MKTLTLRARLMTGFVTMALMVLGLASYMLIQEDRIRAEVQHLANIQADIDNRLQDLREDLNAMQRNAFQGGLNRDRALLLYAAGEASALFEAFDELRQYRDAKDPKNHEELIDFLDKTERMYRETTARAFETLGELAEGGTPDKERMSRLRLDNIQLNSAYDSYLSKVRGDNAVRLQEFIDRMEELRSISLAIIALALIAMTAFLYLLNTHLSRPLRQLSTFVDGLDDPVSVKERIRANRPDEIGKIGDGLNAMLDRLRDSAVSKEHFNRILTSLTNGIIVISPNLQITSLNEAASEFLGVSAEDAMQHPIGELLPESICAALASGEGIDNKRIQLQPREGKSIPALVYAKHIDERNEWLLVITNISTQLESEERTRLLIDNAQDAVIGMNNRGAVTAWNPKASAMFGWTESEALGRNLGDLIVPQELRHLHAAGLERFLATRVPHVLNQQIEVNAMRQDGTLFPVELALWSFVSGGETMFGAFLRDISVRRTAEIALKHSEERYRQVIENVSEGILIVQHGKIAFANPPVERLVGSSGGEILQRPFTDFVHPDDRSLVIDRHLRRLRGEAIEPHYSFRVLNPAGETIWVDLSAVMIDWEGAPATLSFITDITDRHRLEENLKESLAQRETILENSVVGIAFLNAKGRVQWTNMAMANIFGAPKNSYHGESLEHFYSTRDAYLATGESVAKAVMRGQSYDAELQMRRADGTLFWVYLSGKAIDPRNLSQGTVWVVMDITRRRELEEALKKTSSELEAILQSTLVGITHSINRIHVWGNRKFAEMLGFSPEELIGRSSELHYPDHESWKKLGDLAYPVLARGEPFVIDWPMMRKDGSTLWCQLYGNNVDPTDPGKGAIWSFLDITQRKQAELDIQRALDQQKELNDLKSRFVSMTSHEFRTPLATILSSAELLRFYGDRLPPEEKADITLSIESAVHRMTQMLDNILIIGRADAGKLEFKPAPMTLIPFCRTLANEVAAAIDGITKEAGRLEFETSLAETEMGQLDEKLLRHILGNLLSNAFKYSPDGGKVRFAIERHDQALRFTVTDSGIGIPADDLPKLFETFHRAANVGNISGTGLGMAIVKRAAELHGGHIEVSSTVGQGTQFVVSLPWHAETH